MRARVRARRRRERGLQTCNYVVHVDRVSTALPLLPFLCLFLFPPSVLLPLSCLASRPSPSLSDRECLAAMISISRPTAQKYQGSHVRVMPSSSPPSATREEQKGWEQGVEAAVSDMMMHVNDKNGT